MRIGWRLKKLPNSTTANFAFSRVGFQSAKYRFGKSTIGRHLKSGAELRFSLPTISSTPSFQLDLPLPKSGTGRRIRPPEEPHVREKFPRYMGSAPGTGVLLPLEDGQ